VAHDFNNILTIIQGYSELAALKLQQGEQAGEAIDQIIKAGERASDLTRQLLAFSRRQMLEMKVIDLNILLKELDKMLRRILGEDIEVVHSLAEDLGKIKTDPGQIEQVILNLTVNARDAMPYGGKLLIKTDNVELDKTYAQTHAGVTAGPYVRLSVTDTGAGMPPEVKDRIFEPFFTTKELGKGTGLGLSTIYGIVKQSGGNIWVYSEENIGTTFKIYLPRIDQSSASNGFLNHPQELPRGSETILVAEDEEGVGKIIRQTLQTCGYEALLATNGREAIRLVQEYPAQSIQLLITDVVMPGMSGRELRDHLLTLRPEMKVIFMSGYTDDAVIHHGVLRKEMHFIQKPFPMNALAQKVREILDGP
jgi:CheY-like chemotaxis protein